MRSLMEYFIVVVELCSEIYKFSSGSMARPTFDAIRAVTSTKCEKLDTLANSIQQDMAVPNAPDRQTPRKGHKQAPNDPAGARNRKEIPCHQEWKHSARKAVSALDNQASWQHIRKQITTKSFLQESVYQNWKRKKHSATLVCSGNAGVGKSAMLANVVDDLRPADHDSVVIYFFCTYDEPKSLEPWGILGSFVRQLMHAIPTKALVGSPPILDPQTENSLVKLLKPILSKAKLEKIFFVLDGLYDCPVHSRVQVLQHLLILQTAFHLLLCISAIDVGNQYDGTDSLVDVSRLSVSINSVEMAKFMEGELKHYQETGALNLEDPRSITKICEDASRPPEMSYPLARLYLLHLYRIKSGNTTGQSLAELPTNVSGLLSQLIRYGNPHHETLQRIVELAVTAIEPLTLNQIHDALSIGSHLTMLDVKPTLKDIYTAIDYYEGFFSIDEERLTVHIAHRSIMEYLSNESPIDKVVDTSIAHQKIAKICLTVLTNEPHRASSAIQKDIELDSSSEKGSQNHQHLPRSWKDLQLSSISSIESQMAMTARTTSGPIIPTFQAYASQYWLWHFIHIPAEDTTSINLARQLFTQQKQEINHPGHPNQTLVEWALTNNHTITLSLALQSGMHAQAHPLLISAVLTNNLPTLQTLTSHFHFNLNTLTHNGRPLLWLAFEANHTHVFSHLIHHGATHFDYFDAADRSGLWHAASTGRIALVKRTLATGMADVNAMDVYAMTPLAAAVMGRHTGIVELLLDYPGINTRTLDDDLRTPLQTAELHGFESVAKVLRAYEERVYGGL